MNKIYRVVWNAEAGQWVVASEMAKGRKKASGGASTLKGVLITGSVLALASGFAPPVMAKGALRLCNGGYGSGGTAYGPSGSVDITCTSGANDGADFALTANPNSDTGGSGFAQATTYVRGFNGGALELKAATSVDVLSQMDMKGNKITGLAPGSISADSTDAVTGGQLYNAINSGAGMKYFHANSTEPDSVAGASNSVAIGPGARVAAAAQNSVALGYYATVTANAATTGMALGTGAKSDATDASAIGRDAVASAADTVALGHGAVANRANTVSIGKAGGERQLVNLAKGTADTDAVNVSQLKGVTTALGGGSAVNADGSVKAPSYTVNGSTYNNVGDAITAAASSGGDALKWNTTTGAYDAAHGATTSNKITNVAKGTADTDAVNLSQLKAAGVTVDTNGTPTNAFVTYDTTAKDKITLGGATGTTIANVKDGAVASGSKDAVNGGQLYTVDQKATAAQTAITNINNGAGIKYFHANSTSADSSATTAGSVAIGGKAVAGGGAKSIAIGESASVAGAYTSYGSDGAYNIAVGAGANADGSNGNWGHNTAVGGNAKANNVSDSAFGYGAEATGNSATALGSTAKATASNATALGFNTLADRANTVSVGSGDATTGFTRQIVNVAKGTLDNDAVNVSQLKGVTTALGGGTAVNADGTIKPPSYDVNGTKYSTVGDAIDGLDGRIDTINTDMAPKLKYIKFGYTTAMDASASGADAVAIGGFAQALGDGALAIGANARAMAKNAVAIGQGSSTSAEDTFAVGSSTQPRRIVNVADAKGVSDAVTLGQLNTKIAEALSGSGVKSGGVLKSSTLLGATSSLTPDKLIVAGPNGAATSPTEAKGDKAIAMGLNATANADNAVAAGQNVSVLGTNGVAVGQNIAVNGKNAVGIGATVSAVSDYSVAIGSDGTQINTGAAGAVAIGRAVSVGGEGTVGIGSNIIAASKNSIVLGSSSSDDKRDNVVSVGSAGTLSGTTSITRQIVNVKAGTLDTDAVNVSQLKGVTAALGANATVAADGSITKPQYDIGGTKYDNVNGAMEALESLAGSGSALGVTYDSAVKDKVSLAGTSGTTITNVKNGALAADSKDAVNGSQLFTTNQNVTNLESTVTNIVNGKAGLVQQAAAGAKLTVGKGTDGTQVDFAGTAGARQLINVAAGVVSSTSKDAINGSQLFGASKSVADALGGSSTVNTDGSVKAPSYTISGKTYNNVGEALGAIDAKTTTGNPLGVAYDTATKDTVTLAGTGGTTLANVKAGVANDQAVNVAQLKGITDVIGGDATVGPDGKIVAPSFEVTKADGTKETAHTVADAIDAIDGNVAGLGDQVTNISTTVNNLSKDALQWNADAGTYSAAHGTATESRIANVADAVNAKDAVNKGQMDKALADIATGNNPLAVVYDGSDKSTLTLGGKDATAPVQLKNVADAKDDTDAVNLRQLKEAGLVDDGGSTMDAVVYDANSAKGMVTFGGANGTVLDNVADGLIAQGSRQAINGGQLAKLKDQLSQQITNIDGRVTRIENHPGGGSVPYIAANTSGDKAPADAGTSGTAVGYNTVSSGEGSVAMGDHATAAAPQSAAIGTGATATTEGTNSVALGAGSIADTANTVSIGSEGHERTISHVARGNADSDAATMGQMRETLQAANDYTDQRMNDVWQDLGNEINQVNRQANRGIAAASALINVTPYVPGHTTVNAGMASYRGEAALGIGVSRWSDNGRVNFNAGVSAAKDDEPVFRVGVGYIF